MLSLILSIVNDSKQLRTKESVPKGIAVAPSRWRPPLSLGQLSPDDGSYTPHLMMAAYEMVNQNIQLVAYDVYEACFNQCKASEIS